MGGKKPKPKLSIASDKDQFTAFLSRLERACEWMLGEGVFEKFPSDHLRQIYQQRFAPLKLDFKKDDFPATRETELRELFALRMTDLSMQTLTGSEIPLMDYFRDGLLLINYLEVIAGRSAEWAWLRPAVEAYDPNTSSVFLKAAFPIINFTNSLCMLYGDTHHKKLLVADYSTTTIMRPVITDNKIRMCFVPLPISCVRMDGKSREIVPLCWTDYRGSLAYTKVVPAAIGFTSELDQPVAVYFQHHALMRLSERLSIAGGLLFFCLSRVFEEELTYVIHEGKHLVAVNLFDKKLGYLVTELAEGKLIVRTFLFITNDGVPEGRKLWELTRLKKLDKQYLGIDTLSGITKLKLSENPVLSELFSAAGCADLLNLEDVIYFLQLHTQAKDPVALLKYLQLSPFTMKRPI